MGYELHWSVRAGLAASLALHDTARASLERLLPAQSGFPDGALEAAMGWLARSHEVTGRLGSSKGFSLIHGWLPAYPETSGYVIGSFLKYADRSGAESWTQRAIELGDWEITVQRADGGVLEGAIGTADRSIVFNTGMVIHGWIDLYRGGHGDRFADAARHAGDFLLENFRADGTWNPEIEYSQMPHSYNSRVAWAMLRLGQILDDDRYESAARTQLDWVVANQSPLGWFSHCIFRPGGVPSTHGIAYTMRGLLEGSCLTGDRAYLDAAVKAAEVLMRKMEVHGRLPAAYDAAWTPMADYECVTGTAQTGGIWLRLYQETGDARYLNSGLKAVEQAARRQYNGGLELLRGAVPGSFPIWGRYAPLQFPNWAAKFLADSLMLRDDCLQAS